MGHPVAELLRHCRCWCGEAFRSGENVDRLPLVLHKIVQAEEGAIKAVGVVMMSLFEVSYALLTVVVGINCLVMHMQRRQCNHWQISGQ